MDNKNGEKSGERFARENILYPRGCQIAGLGTTRQGKPGPVNHCATSRGWAKVSRSLTKSDRRWRIEGNHPELFASSLSSFSSSSQPQNAYKNPLPHNYFDLNNNSRRQWRISPHASEPVEKNALEFLNPNHGIKKIQGKRSGKMEKK